MESKTLMHELPNSRLSNQRPAKNTGLSSSRRIEEFINDEESAQEAVLREDEDIIEQQSIPGEYHVMKSLGSNWNPFESKT
jgi:hypothetical protein